MPGLSRCRLSICLLCCRFRLWWPAGSCVFWPALLESLLIWSERGKGALNSLYLWSWPCLYRLICLTFKDELRFPSWQQKGLIPDPVVVQSSTLPWRRGGGSVGLPTWAPLYHWHLFFILFFCWTASVGALVTCTVWVWPAGRSTSSSLTPVCHSVLVFVHLHLCALLSGSGSSSYPCFFSKTKFSVFCHFFLLDFCCLNIKSIVKMR